MSNPNMEAKVKELMELKRMNFKRENNIIAAGGLIREVFRSM